MNLRESPHFTNLSNSYSPNGLPGWQARSSPSCISGLPLNLSAWRNAKTHQWASPIKGQKSAKSTAAVARLPFAGKDNPAALTILATVL